MGARKAKKASPRKAPKVVERAADAKLVERTIRLLHAHDRATSQSERAIGEHLLDRYYGGATDLATSKNRLKKKSYALLASRAEHETTWDEADFRRAVKVAIAWRSLPAGVRSKLAPRALYRLASIDDVARRRDVAKQIVAGALSSRRIDALVASVGAAEQRGGRPATAPGRRLVSGIERLLESVTLRSVDDDLDATERTDLRARLRAAAERLRALAARLAARG